MGSGKEIRLIENHSESQQIPFLSELTSPQVEVVAKNRVLILPLGAIEQHGPHLPLDTDTRITNALVEGLVTRYPNHVVVGPTLPFGSSAAHAGFAGTLSLPQHILSELLQSVLNSAGIFNSILLVTANGGNAPIAEEVVSLPCYKTRNIRVWYPTQHMLQRRASDLELGEEARGLTNPDIHAGRTETSIILALDSELVRTSQAQPGLTYFSQALLSAMQSSGVRSISDNGVLGDPTGASQQEGCLLLGVMTEDLCKSFAAFFLA